MTVKMAHKLNNRVINPSNIERQSAMLTMALFHESTINALKFYGGQGRPEFLETAEFLTIVMNWWKTVNVKSKFLAKQKRDEFREVINKQNLGSKTSFLRAFVDWLEEWESNCQENFFKLTKDAFQCLKHTTEGLASLCEYLIMYKNVEYILLGKIQSDRLEGRFGKLRQMSGGNMFASVKQFLESERSLKLKNLADLDLSLSEMRDLFQDSDDEHTLRAINASNQLLQALDIQNTPPAIPSSTENILFYVAGYFSRSVSKQLNCDSCKNLLISSRIDNVQVIVENDPRLSMEENQQKALYINQCNRGGLIFPSEFMFTACVLAWSLLQKIKTKSELFKLLFQANISSQKIFCLTFLKYIERCETTKESFFEFQCENGHSQCDTLKTVSKKLFNVFSKNFVSMSNSAIHSKKINVGETEHKRNSNALKIQKLQSNQV